MDTSQHQPTLDPAPWADADHSVPACGARISVDCPAVTLTVQREDSAGADLVLTADAATTVTVRLDVPLGEAVGYWHPEAGWERTVTADLTPWRTVSLVRSAPVGCLHDAAGHALLAFAADRTIAETQVRFGASAQHGRFGVWLRFPLAADRSCRLRLVAPGGTVASALRRLRVWLAGLPSARPLPVPSFGRTPVYSTRHSLGRAVNATEVEQEAVLAAELGFGRLLLDDGWQRRGRGPGYAGYGDWRPSPTRFPDLAAHVRAVRRTGLRQVLWIAPLLLGRGSAAHRTWAPFAPHRARHLGCRILDPRLAEVRLHVVETCRALVTAYQPDGLRLDFLNEALAYSGARPPARPGAGYIADLGQAMARMLADIRGALRAARGDDFLLELGEGCTGPAATAYGNALRPLASPGDPVADRIRTLDIALLAPGGAVHSDLLTWDREASPEAVARQFHGALHAVPQLSVRLAELPAAQREVLAFWLATWRRLSGVLLGGHYEPGRPDELYPQVLAALGNRRVVTSYTDRPVRLPTDAWRSLSIVNATTASRVLVEVSAPPRLVRLRSHDARGERCQDASLPLTPGLHELDVPPSGLCTLTLTSGLFVLGAAR
ncbi:alpha-galactosidase [Kitasatospora viridis]|uniref:Alpha-galactosidase n=1 Tax=Kitasatospora viridis TaxID=281105 RepID=A0A561TSL8_9ACTN|nr:alpha-galactosidase [Kitasatospora viridis]TWF90102.1 alpha-galactosidase [Kitasatospora viridis]